MVILRPITPPEEHHDEEFHHPTPTKVKVRFLTKFVQDKQLPVSQNEIFKYCDISKSTGYRLLRHGNPVRRHHNDPYTKDRRGRKPLLSNNDFEVLEDWLIEGRF